MGKENCCEEIIRHDEQLKTIFNKVNEQKIDNQKVFDKHEKQSREELSKMNLRIGKIEKKTENFVNSANRFVYGAVAFGFMTVINIALSFIKSGAK